MPSSTQPPARLPILDALRACAVSAVFLQHLGDRFRPFMVERASSLSPSLGGTAAALFSRGHWGVDIFFVLSGFTLGLGFVARREKGRPLVWSQFLKRRAARILPAYFLALALYLAAKPWMLSSPSFPKALLLHLTLLQGYLAAGGLVWIGASWSLTTESHFYLVAPQLARIFLPAKDGRHPIARTIAIALSLSTLVWLLRAVFHFIALLPHASPALLDLSQRKWAICRIDQFIMGMAASVLFLRLKNSLPLSRIAPFGILATLGLLGLCIPLDNAFYSRPFGGLTYPPLTVCLALLVLAVALLRPPRIFQKALAPLSFLGLVSYGFFLYHQLFLELAPRLTPVAQGDGSWRSLGFTAGIGGVLALILATFSFYAIENPAMRAFSIRSTSSK
jgi:peptidoglycan/LPS O-acetylase OafA/YrhL